MSRLIKNPKNFLLILKLVIRSPKFKDRRLILNLHKITSLNHKVFNNPIQKKVKTC